MRSSSYFLVLPALMLMVSHQVAIAQIQLVDEWKLNFRPPGDGWQSIDFNDADWRKAAGGFGTSDTPGARVGTTWQTNSIWLRKTFQVDALPVKPALLIHHDEDAEVFLNGKLIAKFPRWTTEYQLVPLDEQSRAALKVGQNLLAVHCRQESGGQFIDAHLVDADAVPELPEPVRDTSPYKSQLITEWGAAVNAENAWQEYPRPQLARASWTNLNGHWDYAIASLEQQQPPTEWAGKILVPFSLESRLSSVERLLDRSESLWYRRQFEIASKPDHRTLLNFEAVDYRCNVWVNGQPVGSHVGGNDPFAIDVSSAIRTGQNEVVVRVEDETEAWQLRGKQVINARGIWYTQVSGIWQTVWLEQVPESYIEDLKITTDASQGSISVVPDFGGSEPSGNFRVTVADGDRQVATAESDSQVTLTIPSAKLWSPNSPHLYELTIQLLDDDGQVVDEVRSYAGIRSVGKVRDAQGDLRFTLNGEILFHWGPLDQGWWPDGLLTPPSDAAMLSDIQFLKSAGFNMIRKHIKVEPRRYYYHCDRLGMMLWQDQVSGGKNPDWTRLKLDPTDANWPDDQHAQFMLELERMIDNLENHPSIVVWVPFNEAWGQHRTVEVGQWTQQRDPTRLVNIASGGNFWPVGDVVDHHSYPNPDFPFDEPRYHDFIKVVGEFGGHGLPIQGHLWDADRRNWGYGGLPQNEAEYKARYVKSLEMLNDFRRRGIAAGVYTQTTDVEGEINGLMTYDRKVIKIPAEELKALHQQLFTP